MWDGHLESQKNLDRLKRSIHVDRIGVHSTFVYIYAVLRVLMIWSNCFFLLTCLFFKKRRRCDDNQQITVSHFGEHKRLHLESSKQNYYIISLRAIIKAIFTISISNIDLCYLHCLDFVYLFNKLKCCFVYFYCFDLLMCLHT